MTATSEPSAAARPRLAVLSGPTAVGKGTVVGRLRETRPEVFVSVSATTRPARPGEVDGVHYLFVDDAEFDRLIADGELLEWAVVHNSFRYGTPREPLRAALDAGRPAILEIDLQGARQVKQVCGAGAVFAADDVQYVFLMPPSWEEMVRRLVGRGTESAEERERRLTTARAEMLAVDEFDHIVVNTEIDQAVAELVLLLGLPS
ncbi:guanylate kinase [Microlunatus speluncae]|uniref:guanylate kinase n=1 Tax=Microlunatus speluncae TaxID=2594267 RepID=UPI0012666B14|nr:guanylate kinase [Microlunatus speluncae]